MFKSKLYTCMWCGFKVFNEVFSESEICPICWWQDTNGWLHNPWEPSFSYDKSLLEYQEDTKIEIPLKIRKYKQFVRNPLWSFIDKSQLNKIHYYFPKWKFDEFHEKYPKYSNHHRKIMESAQKYNPDEKVHSN